MSLLLAALLGALGSLALERPAKTASAIAIHCGLWGLAYLLLAALVQRPFLAAALALALHGLIGVVSNAKVRALREPFVFSDFGLFSQALRHPRLYLPYLRPGPVLALGAAFAAALAIAILIEAPQFSLPAWSALLAGSIAAVALPRPQVTLDPARDVARLGLLATAWLYWRAERAPLEVPRTPYLPSRDAGDARPNIVVVQSESFFDPRRLRGGVPPDVLAHFDALRREGESGRLAVPAWGAYTMRGEFAFLSGLAPAALGVHRFNPYRRYARRPVPTIASYLRPLGYRTLCVHPYAGSFFDRDRVMANLGFDEFLDLRAFGGARKAGPYVADAEVGRVVMELLQRSNQPLFVFAITMENHGPLHFEAGAGEDDLAVYLRHLANADALFGELAAALRSRGGVLCAFGDHVPSMPQVYAAARYDDSRTDYLVWRGDGGPAREADLAVEELGVRVLRAGGLQPGP